MQKEHTVKMLKYYLEMVMSEEIDPEIILIHNGRYSLGGSDNWCGITFERKDDILRRELDRNKELMASRE